MDVHNNLRILKATVQFKEPLRHVRVLRRFVYFFYLQNVMTSLAL